MAQKLTKTAILEGAGATEDLVVPGLLNGEPGTVTIRHLTDGEINKAKRMRSRGVAMGLNMDASELVEAAQSGLSASEVMEGKGTGLQVNLGDIAEGEDEATYFIAACALSCDGERWIPSEVEAMPSGCPGIIADRALLISGATKEAAAAVATFPDDAGQSGDGAVAQGGVSPDSDASPDDAVPAGVGASGPTGSGTADEGSAETRADD